MRIFFFFPTLLFLLWSHFSTAQNPAPGDSTTPTVTQVKFDSVAWKKEQKKIRDPRKASLLSAIFPGAGQFYNRKYWKLPIVYGGAFTLGYFINLNHEEYVKTRDAYLQVQAGKPDRYNGLYDAEQLVRLREYWRRNRDLLIIISSFTYLLNIADAAVDAHLSSFDVSDDLSFQWKPMFYIAGNQPVAGVQMAFLIK
jgi:hypothetical protein